MARSADASDARRALLTEIGNKLATARLALREEPDVAARKLKLRKKHLEALESGNWDAMPDDIYAMGFLRQYSAYLRLDLTEEIERLKNNVYALTRPLTFPDPPVAPSRRWAWVAAGMFVILIVAFNFLYQNLGSNRPLSDMATSPTQGSAPGQSGKTTVKLLSGTMSISSADATDTKPKTAGETAVNDTLPTNTHAGHPQATVVPTQQLSLSTGIDTTGSEPLQGGQPASKAVVLQAAGHLYTFDAVDSAVWLQISLPNQTGSGKGRLIKEVLLQQGHHISIRQPVDALWITCGNAPALRISVDGKLLAAAGSLGAGRKVLRDHRISIKGQ